MTAVQLIDDRAEVRFGRFDLDAFDLFLRVKRLPEKRLTYDWRTSPLLAMRGRVGRGRPCERHDADRRGRRPLRSVLGQPKSLVRNHGRPQISRQGTSVRPVVVTVRMSAEEAPRA